MKGPDFCCPSTTGIMDRRALAPSLVPWSRNSLVIVAFLAASSTSTRFAGAVAGSAPAGPTTNVTVQDGAQSVTLELLNQHADQFPKCSFGVSKF